MKTNSTQTALGLAAAVAGGGYDAVLERLYGPENRAAARGRYEKLLRAHAGRYGDGPVRIFSSPGRIELGGNHTDHNHGKALAGAVDLDSLAVVSVPAPGVDTIRVYSENFAREYTVRVGEPEKRQEEEKTSQALIRGTMAWFLKEGLKAGAFNATVQSTVFAGSGLSSSASFEVLIASIFDGLWNGSKLHPSKRALCGKYAENVYFGKPCGLLDQLTCSTGGVISIDFIDPASPGVRQIAVDFTSTGYRLCIVNTRSDHAADTETYASIPREMGKVAAWFGKSVLREVTPGEFRTALPKLMKDLPGRAVSRAGHFMAENLRVDRMVESLSRGDFPSYLRLVELSGNSSFKYLQNVIDCEDNQDYGLVLQMIETFESVPPVTTRMQGGGFGGTVQAYVPTADWDRFVAAMEGYLGKGCVTALRLRKEGAEEILL